MKNILRVAEGLFINTILITLLICQGLYAAEKTLPTPEEIIAKNIEARGGISAFKKIINKKIVRSHKVVPMNLDVKETIYQERPNNYYSSSVSSMGTVREGATDKMAWIVSPFAGTRLLEGDELSKRLPHSKFDGPDLPYRSMKTESIEQINGKDCYKVVKIPENGPETIEYYDKKSFMIVKTISEMMGTKFETYIEEYKKINGILFPIKEVCYVKGKEYEVITHEIELNTEMPEGIFDIPEEVKATINKNETELNAQQ